MQLSISAELRKFADFAGSQMNQKNILDTESESPTNAQKAVGEDAILDVSGGLFSRSVKADTKGRMDHYGFLGRTQDQKDINNAARKAFLNAVISHYGGSLSSVPKSVQNALKIGKFGSIDKNATADSFEVTSGKPLTARRINAVITAINADIAEHYNAMSPVEYGYEIATVLADMNMTSEAKKETVGKLLGRFVTKLYGSYSIKDRSKIGVEKNAILAILFTAKDAQKIRHGSALNCHLIGHPDLSKSGSKVDSVFEHLHNLAWNVPTRDSLIAQRLEEDCIELTNTLLRELCGVKLDGMKDGEKVGDMMLKAQKAEFLGKIEDFVKVRAGGKFAHCGTELEALKAKHQEINRAYGNQFFPKLLAKSGEFYDDLTDSRNYAGGTLKPAFREKWLPAEQA